MDRGAARQQATARGAQLARDLALALSVCGQARLPARRSDRKHQAAPDQGRRIPHLDRGRDRAIRGAPSNRHEAAPRVRAVTLHRATAQRCRAHGPPAHQGRRAHGEAAKDRRDLSDPRASTFAGSARCHAGRAPDVSGHHDRQALRRQCVHRAISQLVRRRRTIEPLQAARTAQGGMPKTRGSRMLGKQDHGDQRTRDDERTCPLHPRRRSGAARPQCDGEGGDPMIRRRAFITLLGGAAAWPLAARAQQPEQVRRVGWLIGQAAGDAGGKARLSAFGPGLQQLGWTDGRNVRIDTRWGGGDADRMRRYAAELVALAPDVILAGGTAAVGILLQATRTVPVVFATVSDPVGAGYVDSVARPGGNATGFLLYEYGTSGKWLELLKEIAPGVTRVAVIREAAIAAGIGQLGAIQSVAPSFGVELTPLNVRDAAEIERAVTVFAKSSKGGLILTGSTLALVHRDLIIMLAARHKLPAVYNSRLYVASGGRISYGPEFTDQYRQAAGYVDRILKGEKPGDLPVQAPTKYELLINLKTAKALGLDVPPTLLARADEVIE